MLDCGIEQSPESDMACWAGLNPVMTLKAVPRMSMGLSLGTTLQNSLALENSEEEDIDDESGWGTNDEGWDDE